MVCREVYNEVVFLKQYLNNICNVLIEKSSVTAAFLPENT